MAWESSETGRLGVKISKNFGGLEFWFFATASQTNTHAFSCLY